jgi:hypothetical protein
VARLPREIVRHRTIAQLIGQTKRIVNVDPEEHTIGGRAVTEAEINQAEQVLFDPARRIAEELLEHAAERHALDDVKQLENEVASALRGNDALPLPVTNLRGLLSWSQSIVRQFLDEAEQPDPGFGALELDLVRPFGAREET